jgi:hypothetical protein
MRNGGAMKMKKISFMLMLSALLVVGFSTGALAVTDGTGDQFVPGKDLASAEVLLYPPPTGSHPDWVRLTVTMAGGSTMPGMITWDFDADNDAGTGGGSSLNMPFPPCGPNRCKTDEGFDFYIVMVLRDQGDTSQLAYCSGCVGGQTCVTRGPEVPGCNEQICYEPLDSCAVGDANCYVQDTDSCTGSLACDNAYPLQTPCGIGSEDCGDGMKWGEYYVGAGQGGGNDPVLRGRVYFEESIVDSATEYCFHLPWGDFIAYASIAGAVDFGAVSQNPDYQVSVWHDNVFLDNNDMFDAGLILNLSDYVPDSGKASDSSVGEEECLADTNSDCKVNLTDLVQIKSEFLRNDCPNCCP